MTHKESKSEIIYIAEADSSSKLYKFDLDLGAQMDEFKSKSGDYVLALLLGELILGFRCKNCFGSGSLFMSGSDFFSLNPDPQKRLKIVSTSVKIFF